MCKQGLTAGIIFFQNFIKTILGLPDYACLCDTLTKTSLGLIFAPG